MRSAEASGAGRMDRREGAKPKDRGAGLFQARDGGKPPVAQPPERDKAKRGGERSRADGPEGGRETEGPQSGPVSSPRRREAARRAAAAA